MKCDRLRLRGIRVAKEIVHTDNILCIKISRNSKLTRNYAPYLAILNSSFLGYYTYHVSSQWGKGEEKRSALRNSDIENLYLLAIIEAYKSIRTHDSVDGLSENEIRNKFTYNFKHHNSFLKEYLNNYTIILTKENEIYAQDETRRTDIELISSGHRNKFVIECKRLAFAETRYVNGSNDRDGNYRIDGLEKFTEPAYSETDECAGMLGFIVKGKPSRIVGILKSKVRDFHPSESMELLIEKKCGGWGLSFQSIHIRSNGNPIHLYHLFFDFVI